MRSLVLPGVLLVMLATGAARAEYIPKPAAPPVHVGISVNPPGRWPGGDALAGSLHIGLTRHQALRLNVASYEYTASAAAEVIGVLAGGDGEEGSYAGRTTDLGIGWTWYSRALWDGFMVEAGLLRRAKDHHVEDEFAPAQILDTDTATYAARATIGWSWLINRIAFVSISVGLSAGYERGTETSAGTFDYLDHKMPVTTDVARFDLASEGFVRIGAAFDL